MAANPSGGFVAAGEAGATSTTVRDFAVARYTDSASLDSSFGTGGKARYDFAAGRDDARAVAVQPDGRIVAVGTTSPSSGGSDFAVVRYMPDGTVDGSFGTNGSKTIDFVGYNDAAEAVAIQPDGKIVVAGSAEYSISYNTGVARLNIDGSLDSGGAGDLTPGDSFGTNGKAAVDVVTYWGDGAFAVAVQPDGKIVTGGNAKSDFALVRFTAAGVLDSTFGSGGKVVTDIAGAYDNIEALVLQRDGRIVVAGWTDTTSSNQDSVVARYNVNGSLDSGFLGDSTPLDTYATNGKVIKSLGANAGHDRATTMALRADGRIVVGGWAMDSIPCGDTTCTQEAFASFGLLTNGADDPLSTPQKISMICSNNGPPAYCNARGYGIVAQGDSGAQLAGWTYGSPGAVLGFAVANFSGSGAGISSSPVYWDADVTTNSSTGTYPNPGYISLPANNGLDRNGNNSATGDPVSAVTGNLTSYEQDLLLQAPGISTQMVRSYNSSEASVDGPIGRGWTFTYGASLKQAPSGDVTFREPDGAQRMFIHRNDGSFKSPEGNFDVLSGEANGAFKLMRRTGVAWKFDASGRLISLTDLNANTLSLTYTSGRLTGVTDPAGHQVTFAYNAGGRISVMTSPGVTSADRSVSYAYNSSGELTSVTDLAGAVTTYGYNAKHQLTTMETPGDITNPGTTRTFSYEATTGRVSSQTETGGVNKLEYTYEPQSARTLVKDSKTNQSIYYYDSRGQVTRIVDPYGKELLSGWNSAGNKTKTTDHLLNTTDLTYDASGNTTQVKAPKPLPTSPTRPTTDYTYGANGRPVAITDEDGTTSFGYDSSGNLTLLRDARSKDTTFTVNSRGQVLTKTDALRQTSGGPTVQYRYNTNGTLAEAEDASGRVTTFAYDAAGRAITVTLPGGRSTNYEYDAADRVTKVTLPAATTGATRGTLQTSYDPRGNAIAAKDENGYWSYRAYDEHDRLISAKDATNRETTYTYDTESNLTDTTAPSGVVTHLTYDSIRRLQTSTVGYGTTSALTTNYDYFETGQLKRHTDPKSHITAYTYDALGRLTSTTEGSGTSDEATTGYEYTATGDLSKVTNPNGRWTSYEYWPTGQMKTKKVQSSDPANPFTWSWTLDADGQVLTRTDAEGAVTTYSYDANGEVLGIDEPTGTADVTHTYAATTGDLATTTDGTGTTSYTYDGLARLTEETLPGSRVRKQEFDLAGNRTRLELPGSDVRRFTYDDANRLTKVYDGSATDTAARENAYVYDTAGRLSTATHVATGASRSYSYDALERLSSVTNRATDNSVIAKRDYSYDAASNTTSIADENSVQATYTYDNLDRLTSERTAGASPTDPAYTDNLDRLTSKLVAGVQPIDRTYTYDPAGNRKTLVEGTTTTTYAYDTAERLTGYGTTTNVWNRNGELTSKTTGGLSTTYAWDGEGRTTGIDLPGTTPDESFAYDAAGRRVSATTGAGAGATTTSSLFDGSDVAQQRATGGPVTRYVRGMDDELLSMEAKSTGTGVGAFNGDSASLRSFHLDAQNSVVALSNGSGQGSDNYAYTAFGDLNNSSGVTPNPFGYLSNETHPAAKVHNFHARSYAAADGRFLSRDPDPGDVSLPQSLNPYVYGANNPFAHPDPYGASWLGDAGMGISGGVAWGLSVPFRAAGVPQEDIAGGYLRVGEYLPVSSEVDYYLAARGTKGGVNWAHLAVMGALDVGTGGRGRAALEVGEGAFKIGRHGNMPKPRGGRESHHGVNSIWSKANLKGYNANRAPALLMPRTNHHRTFGVFNRMRAEIRREQGAKRNKDIDWSAVTPGRAWKLAEEQFDAANVPQSAREEYFRQFNRYREGR